jgi:hypothetical protein
VKIRTVVTGERLKSFDKRIGGMRGKKRLKTKLVLSIIEVVIRHWQIFSEFTLC